MSENKCVYCLEDKHTRKPIVSENNQDIGVEPKLKSLHINYGCYTVLTNMGINNCPMCGRKL